VNVKVEIESTLQTNCTWRENVLLYWISLVRIILIVWLAGRSETEIYEIVNVGLSYKKTVLSTRTRTVTGLF